MDNDANTLNGALAALQQQFGRQLAGAKDAGLGQMRQALSAQMGLDELTADRVVKKLTDTGRLRFMGSGDGDGDDLPGQTATGPVLSLPGVTTSGGTGELILPTGPALAAQSTPGGAATAGGSLGGGVPVAAGLNAIGSDEQADAGESLGAPDVAARRMENQAGATMGQLADTNAEGGVRRPETVGDRQERTGDSPAGYWQIG